jgi:hypothetical protein
LDVLLIFIGSSYLVFWVSAGTHEIDDEKKLKNSQFVLHRIDTSSFMRKRPQMLVATNVGKIRPYIGVHGVMS